MESKRILVTGGTGFIGAHLTWRLCEAGHDVHVAHRAGSDPGRLRALGVAPHLHPCDLADSRSIAALLDAARPQVIYHLAGDASLRYLDAALAGVDRSLERNVRPTLNLVVAAQDM